MFRRTAASVALVALLAGTASTSPAHAATPRDGAFRYTESAGNATIVGWDPDVAACPSALSIPATVGASIPVTEIDDSAFLDEPCMKSGATTSLTLPTSVTTLNPSAFRGDSSLTAITINGALTNIPAYAFAGNTGLQTITFNANGPAYVETAFAGVSPTASGGPSAGAPARSPGPDGRRRARRPPGSIRGCNPISSCHFGRCCCAARSSSHFPWAFATASGYGCNR